MYGTVRNVRHRPICHQGVPPPKYVLYVPQTGIAVSRPTTTTEITATTTTTEIRTTTTTKSGPNEKKTRTVPPPSLGQHLPSRRLNALRTSARGTSFVPLFARRIFSRSSRRAATRASVRSPTRSALAWYCVSWCMPSRKESTRNSSVAVRRRSVDSVEEARSGWGSGRTAEEERGPGSEALSGAVESETEGLRSTA